MNTKQILIPLDETVMCGPMTLRPTMVDEFPSDKVVGDTIQMDDKIFTFCGSGQWQEWNLSEDTKKALMMIGDALQARVSDKL